PLCYSHEGRTLAFSDRADAVPLSAPAQIDEQAIFNYVYFHMIPAPRTIFRGVERLEGAQVIRFDGDGSKADFWWRPRFEAIETAPVDGLKRRFLELVEQAVKREATTERIGSYLSGGTDT